MSQLAETNGSTLTLAADQKYWTDKSGRGTLSRHGSGGGVMGEPIEALAAIIAKVAALHQPQPIYGECFHAPGYGCTPVEAPWIDACNQSIEGWYCRECCTANDVYLQADCPHGWDHAACTAISACATMDALTGSEVEQ